MLQEDFFDYLEAHTSRESEVLYTIVRNTGAQCINARMVCGAVEGRLLKMLSQMIQPHRILELGTFTGYSALCLAEGLDATGELITIEHNDELEPLIRKHLALSPLGNKIHLIIGDALETIRQQKGLFDLVFIDADKRAYPEYLEAVLPLVRPGGYILADNTLWDGHILDPAYAKDAQTQGVKRFNDLVMAHSELECVLLPLRDGLTLIRRQPEIL